jgi:quinoprotein glucose dehydrogenase
MGVRTPKVGAKSGERKRRPIRRTFFAIAALSIGVFAYRGCSPQTLQYTRAAALFMFDAAYCSLGYCEPSVPAGLTVREASTDTGPDPLVAIDVDASGRVLATHSPSLNGGILDNRSFSEEELDEELALMSADQRRDQLLRWVSTGRLEPEDIEGTPDAVVAFTDEDGDGSLETRVELASFPKVGAGIGAGILARGDDVYYANIPDLWLLRDEDGDGSLESREILSQGWGVRWTFLGHDLHGIVQGPDGKIYFSVGDRGFHVETGDGRTLRPDIDPGRGAVLRMNPDGSDLEVFAQGLRNPQEIAFDDYGNIFTVDNNSDSLDQARIAYVVEGGDSGWVMPYQLLRDPDYERGPWNAEKLWYPQHEEQPAWVIPPLRFLGRGPSGLAFTPGLGLPERWNGHFLAADYAYRTRVSGIRAFRVESEGAGYRVSEPEWFLRYVLVTDFDFALDGSMFVSWYRQIPPSAGGFYRIDLDAAEYARQKPALDELRRLLEDGMAARSAGELAGLLGFEDRRVRMPAQFELARRGDASTLNRVARDAQAPELARIHALWGLGQIGAGALRETGWTNLDWIRGEEAEIRAQVARLVGTAREPRLAPALLPLLEDENLRVRYFAALSLGKVGYRPALPALLDLLEDNGDRDVFLRHAAVIALTAIASGDDLSVLVEAPSRSVRMAALLAMRRTRDPQIALFLEDADPLLVAEAARAIYDLPIPEAEAALASLAGDPLSSAGDTPQTGLALHRRVIHANVRQGTEEAALRLGAHASRDGVPEEMRREALWALEGFTRPPSRDPVLGNWYPLPERPTEVVYAAIDTHVPELTGGPLESAALEVAAAYERVPLDDEELLDRLGDPGRPDRSRLVSLRVLDNRQSDSASRAIDLALASGVPELRAAARDILVDRDPSRALLEIDTVAADAPLSERQQALASLGRLQSADAEARLLETVEAIRMGNHPTDTLLDALEAARARDTPALREAVVRYRETFDPEDPLAPYLFATQGGDAIAGVSVFNGNGDCKRCHAIDGEGGETGPDLSAMGARMGSTEILEALILPNAKITAGYAAEDGTSPMPAVAAELPPRELRDLVAYLASLN